MSHKTVRRLRLVYGFLLSALIIALGIGFMVSCVAIYRTGASPFTKESIGTAFARFAPLAYVTLAGVVLGIVGDILLAVLVPAAPARPKARRDLSATLAGLSARVSLASCTEETRATIRRARRARRILWWGAVAVTAIAAVPALVWCLDPAHFAVENLNDHIIAAAAVILPCTLVALGVWVAVVYLRAASVKREIALLKAALVEASKAAKTQGTIETVNADKANLSTAPSVGRAGGHTDRRLLWGVRGVILAAGIVFIVLGVLNGGMADVLGKAVRICTECIGLG